MSKASSIVIAWDDPLRTGFILAPSLPHVSQIAAVRATGARQASSPKLQCEVKQGFDRPAHKVCAPRFATGKPSLPGTAASKERAAACMRSRAKPLTSRSQLCSLVSLTASLKAPWNLDQKASLRVRPAPQNHRTGVQ